MQQYSFFMCNGVLRKVPYDDILFIQADNGKSKVYQKSTLKFFIARTSLLEIYKILPKEIFHRANKSYIVNLNYTESIDGSFCYIKEMPLVNITISALRRKSFIDKLKSNCINGRFKLWQ